MCLWFWKMKQTFGSGCPAGPAQVASTVAPERLSPGHAGQRLSFLATRKAAKTRQGQRQGPGPERSNERELVSHSEKLRTRK